jgi:hypothetical protein
MMITKAPDNKQERKFQNMHVVGLAMLWMKHLGGSFPK